MAGVWVWDPRSAGAVGALHDARAGAKAGERGRAVAIVEEGQGQCARALLVPCSEVLGMEAPGCWTCSLLERRNWSILSRRPHT